MLILLFSVLLLVHEIPSMQIQICMNFQKSGINVGLAKWTAMSFIGENMFLAKCESKDKIMHID